MSNGSRPSFFSQLFTFRGRTNRARYWLVLLIFAGLSAIGGLGLLVLRMLGQGAAAVSAVVPIALMGAALAVYVLGAVIGIFNAIRRLHDRNKSGHWLWLFYFLPSLLNVVVQIMVPPGANPQQVNPVVFVPMLVSFAIILWAIVELGFLRGTRGPNRFGPDPLATA